MRGYGLQICSAIVGIILGALVVWISFAGLDAMRPDASFQEFLGGDWFGGMFWVLLAGGIVWIALCLGFGAFHGWRFGTKLMMRRVERILGEELERGGPDE